MNNRRPPPPAGGGYDQSALSLLVNAAENREANGASPAAPTPGSRSIMDTLRATSGRGAGAAAGLSAGDAGGLSLEEQLLLQQHQGMAGGFGAAAAGGPDATLLAQLRQQNLLAQLGQQSQAHGGILDFAGAQAGAGSDARSLLTAQLLQQQQQQRQQAELLALSRAGGIPGLSGLFGSGSLGGQVAGASAAGLGGLGAAGISAELESLQRLEELEHRRRLLAASAAGGAPFASSAFASAAGQQARLELPPPAAAAQAARDAKRAPAPPPATPTVVPKIPNALEAAQAAAAAAARPSIAPPPAAPREKPPTNPIGMSVTMPQARGLAGSGRGPGGMPPGGSLLLEREKERALLAAAQQQRRAQQQQQQQPPPSLVAGGDRGAPPKSRPSISSVITGSDATPRVQPAPPAPRGDIAGEAGKVPGSVIVPCKARGMPMDHNFKTAFFAIPEDVKHGEELMCSYFACRNAGNKFRYCSYCKVPVARRNFRKRHKHGGEIPAGVDDSDDPDEAAENDGTAAPGLPPGASAGVMAMKQPGIPSQIVAPHKDSMDADGISSQSGDSHPPRGGGVADPARATLQDNGQGARKLPLQTSGARTVIHPPAGGFPGKLVTGDGRVNEYRQRRWMELLLRRPSTKDGDSMSNWLMEVLAVSDLETPLKPEKGEDTGGSRKGYGGGQEGPGATRSSPAGQIVKKKRVSDQQNGFHNGEDVKQDGEFASGSFAAWKGRKKQKKRANAP